MQFGKATSWSRSRLPNNNSGSRLRSALFALTALLPATNHGTFGANGPIHRY